MRLFAHFVSPGRLLTPVLLLLGLFLSLPAQAQWSHDPEVNTVVSHSVYDPYYYQSADDGQGGVFLVWVEYDGGNFSYRAQHVLRDGTFAWGPDGVVVFANEPTRERPRIVRDDMFGAYVAVLRSIGGYPLAYVQRLDMDGAKRWGADGIQVSQWAMAGISQRDVQIIRDRNFGLIIAYFEDGPTSCYIYVQRMDFNGNRVWGNIGYPTDSPNVKTGLTLAEGMNPGESLVGWEEDGGANGWDLHIQRLYDDGTNSWSGSSMDLSTSPDDQEDLHLACTGNGEVVSVWQDHNGSTPVVHYQLQQINGTRHWGSSGYELPGQYDTQISPRLARDTDGNVYIAYLDQTGTTAGRVALVFTSSFGDLSNSMTLVRNEYDVFNYLAIAADDPGSCYVAWNGGNFSDNFTLHHVDIQGRSLWPEDTGAFAITSLAYQNGREEMSLHAFQGEVIAAWNGHSSLTEYRAVRAQKIDHNGFMGDNDFAVTAAVDRPNDQGGEVTLTWDASPLDVPAFNAVANYSLWIKPMAKSTGLVARGLPAAASYSDKELGAYLDLPEAQVAGLKSAGWTFAGLVPAMNSASYSALCPTYGDSTAAGITYTAFQVVAHHQDNGIYWSTDGTFQGYSVDNLAPGAPLNLAGSADAGSVTLDWLASGQHDEDLAQYRVYRGVSSGFALDAGSLVGSTVETGFQDAAQAGTVYYRVTAVDAHGNEGQPSAEIMVTSSVSGVGDTPAVFAHLGNYPNPFNPMTRISFSLSHDGPVRVQVFDTAGRLVRTLIDGVMTRGAHQVQWNGTDAGGRAVPSGIYFSRIQDQGQTLTRRMTLVR